MAFNWPVFRTRALTALVFVAVMAVGLLWNQWSFLVLFSIVHFGAWLEYRKLVSGFFPAYRQAGGLHFAALVCGGWCLLLYFTEGKLQVGGASLPLAGWWGACVLLLLAPRLVFAGRRAQPLSSLGYSLGGLLYISLSLALLVHLRHRDYAAGPQLAKVVPLLVIFSIWINDTMAYIVGSLIGKTPLSPISPKKTWEGTIGGALLAVVVMCLLAWATDLLPLRHAAAVSAIAAVAGTYGDLFESKLKRMAGVKDSGSFMPGHGGFLDRFDSLLFAATAVWIYVAIFL